MEGCDGEGGVGQFDGDVIGESGVHGIMGEDGGGVVVAQNGFLIDGGPGLVLDSQP